MDSRDYFFILSAPKVSLSFTILFDIKIPTISLPPFLLDTSKNRFQVSVDGLMTKSNNYM